MEKVQEYLKQKEIKEKGLPKIYVVKSTREGVGEIQERQVVNIIEGGCGVRLSEDGKKVNLPIHKYVLDKEGYPYNVGIVEGRVSNIEKGLGSGFGDVWSWTYFSSTSKEEAENFVKTETKRIKLKYTSRNEAIEFAEWLALGGYKLMQTNVSNNGTMFFRGKDWTGETADEVYKRFLESKTEE